MSDLADLSALAARERLTNGDISAAELTEALLGRIAAREPEIGAFAFLDPALARAAARRADDDHARGRPLRALHGLAIAVKDIIDTADMPTENGTVLDAGRHPGVDATIVHRLRQAGAIIIGKAVTTELAYFAPGKTRNPRDRERTPGGSSSGSAAAVAAGMVPLAVGTQTYGSVIRPASFCGVVGFKPTHGLIPRTGIRLLAAPLDTVGVFARTVVDAALIADALGGYDPADPDTRPLAPPLLLDAALRDAPATPRLAFVRTPAWDEAEPATKTALAGFAAALGKACAEVALPEVFDGWLSAHRTLMLAGMAHNLADYYRRGRDYLSDRLRAAVEDGMKIGAVDYLAALDLRAALTNELDRLFVDCDAIITPAAPGEAPRGLASTGNPVFAGLWTLCGVPAVTLPLLRGPDGMPIGIQVVGRRGEDASLLRTARWLSVTFTRSG